MKSRPSTMGRILLFYQQRIPKRMHYLILIAAIFFVWQLMMYWNSSDDMPGRKNVAFAEPNQTLWKELLALEPKKLNHSSPTVSALTSLIILIPLTATSEQRRQEIRASWGHKNSSKAIQSGLVTVLFVVGQNRYLDRLLLEENKKHGDILVTGGQMMDSYKGLVYKLLIAFRWVHYNYPHVEVVKADSDVVVDVDRLHRAVNKEVHKKKFIMGYLWKNTLAHRDPFDPWYIPHSVYPHDYVPLYANGPLYIFSSSALEAILKVASRQRVFEVEDVFFTGVLSEIANVELIHLDGLLRKFPWSQRCEDGRPTLLAYPVHNTVLGMRIEYERMKTIPCKWWLQNLIGL